MAESHRARNWGRRIGLGALNLGLAAACTTSATTVGQSTRDEEGVVAAERDRLSALVAADMEAAERLHADDFSVINPLGRSSSRAAYLAAVASGESDYLSWEPEDIEVRVRGPMAAIRYRSRVDLAVRGQRLPPMEAWNTGVYERRGGEWMIVWFQVTQVAPQRP